MKLLLLTLALAGGVVDGALHSFTVQNTDNTKTDLNAGATYHATNPAGTFCSGCDEVANMQPNAVLTCKTASTGIVITQSATSTSGSVVNGGCKLGFFRTAGTGDGNDTCTACEANCQICSTATNCTKPMAGFFLSAGDAVPAACTATTDDLCKDVVGFAGSTTTVRGYKLGQTAAEACLAGISASGAGQTHNTANTTHEASAAGGCKNCPVGKVADRASDTGCVTCPAITNMAGTNTGGVDAHLTCTSPSGAGAATASKIVAGTGAGGILTSKECAFGYFYTANAANAAGTCTACEATITAGACSHCTDATTCTGVSAGYYLAGANPVACTATTAAECNDAGPSGLMHTHKTAEEACPASSGAGAGHRVGQPGHATQAGSANAADDNFATTTANLLGGCAAGCEITIGGAPTGANDGDPRTITACATQVATFTPALSGNTAAATTYVLNCSQGCAACVGGKVSKASGTPGCQDCPVIDNSATGAVLSCTGGVSAATASKIAANVATGVHTGRKCKPGFFYTAGGTTAMATCTACETNCYTCSSATACTHVKEGYYRAAAGSGNPTACTARTDAQCSAVANKTQFPLAVATVCTAGNNASADITDATGCTEYAKTCPVVGTSPAGVAAPGIFAALLAAVAAALRM